MTAGLAALAGGMAMIFAWPPGAKEKAEGSVSSSNLSRASELGRAELKRRYDFGIKLQRAGISFSASGEEDDALLAYDLSIQSYALLSVSWANRAKLHLRRDDLFNARRDSEIALRLDPRNPVAMTTLADVEIADENYTKAIELMTRAIKIPNGNRLPYYQKRGHAYAMAGRFKAAIDDTLAAIELNPDNVGLHCDLAVLNARRGDLDGAREAIRRAVEVDMKAPCVEALQSAQLQWDELTRI